MINCFLINRNVFICIIDTNVVLVKLQNEVISSEPKHLRSRHSILHPPDFLKIYLHHTQPAFSTFVSTRYKTSPTKTYSVLSVMRLHGTLLQQCLSSSPPFPQHRIPAFRLYYSCPHFFQFIIYYFCPSSF